MSAGRPVGRRELLGGLAVAATLPRFDRLRLRTSGPRLSARPGKPARPADPGLHELGLGDRRDGLLYVPESHRADQPLPLAVLLHGAGQRANELIDLHMAELKRAGLAMVLLATDSRASTWDAIRGDFGPDVEFLDRALRHAFERCAIDPARLTLAGFSDGATYSLALGCANGDLFPRIVAYSPGFLIPVPLVNRPAIFITHGQADRILPVTSTTRRIVPRLRLAGYDVELRLWDGGHRIPPDLLTEAVGWMAKSP